MTIVTALYRREKTGLGGLVKSSLLQNGLWANGCAVQTRLFGEHVAHRPAREEAPNALANHYQSRDGRWFIMALFNEQRQLRGFLAAIGREDLTNDPRFATNESRKQFAGDLVKILDAEFAKRDLNEWRVILDGVGVTFGIVGTVNEVAGRSARCATAVRLVAFADGEQLNRFFTVSYRRRGESAAPTCRPPSASTLTPCCARPEAMPPMRSPGCAYWAFSHNPRCRIRPYCVAVASGLPPWRCVICFGVRPGPMGRVRRSFMASWASRASLC